MRLSRLFAPTLHQAPTEAVEASHRLLLRAGLLRALGAGSFACLPLGQRVRRRLQDVTRQALALCGGQELSCPPVVPAGAWDEAGVPGHDRGAPLRDAAGRSFLLPRSLEPLLVALLRPDLRSHRALPLLLYGFRPRWGAATPAGLGPLSARQSLVLEAIGVYPAVEALGKGVQDLLAACRTIAAHCGLREQFSVLAYPEEDSYELVVPVVPGEEPFARCPGCGYSAALHRARRAKVTPPAEEALPLEGVLTPDCHTIAQLAAFLGVPESRTAKAVFVMEEERFFFVVVRGDMDVDEEKLARLVGAVRLRPAVEHEIAALGASPGFASPIGIRRAAPEVGVRQVQIVVDDLVPRCPNLVAGANKEDMHLRNVNYGRDYTADLVADITAVHAGDPCPQCGGPLELFQSTTLGRVWAAGDRISTALGATFQDTAGQDVPLQLACAEVDIDRLLAAVVEVHHDEAGIRWPVRLAPWGVHLLAVGNAPEVVEAAESLYETLQAAGVAALYDDRDASPGSKFAEADLLGLPLRVAVGKRTVGQRAVEVKRRDQPREAVQVLPFDELLPWIEESLQSP